MPLTVLCGPFQPSLEEAFLERLAALAPGPSRRVAVVAPSRHLSARLQRLIALEKGRSLLNVRFHNFHTLALEILEGAGFRRADVIADDVFYDRLVREILEERLDGGRRLSRGLAAAFRNSLTDLMEANVDPAQFLEHFGELLEHDGDRDRLRELLDVQRAFMQRLAENRVLPFYGVAQEATGLVRTRRAEALGHYAEILAYGFYDLNGTDADFFQAVAETQPTTLFCPYLKGHPAYAYADRFVQLKLHSGGRAPVNLPSRAEERAVGKALDDLFAPGRAAPPKDERALTVLNVSGLRDEVWRVAKEIRRLREDPRNPLGFGDIGVVARDVQAYRAVVRDVFGENGIPYAMAAAEPLLRYPLAKLALNVLLLRRRDFPADMVQDVIASPSFAVHRHAGKALLRSHWKRVIDRLGIHSGWLQWQGKLPRAAERDFELFPQLVAEGLAGHVVPREDTAALWEFVRGLHARLDPRRSHASWAALAEEARAILEETFLPPTEAREADVWAACLAALESLRNFDRLKSPPDWDAFLDVLEEKFGRATVDGAQDNAGVRVMGVMEARGESFRALFLMGLKEGAFPRQVREDPLLRDSLRAFLQQPGGHWILPKLAGYDEEKLLFHLMATAASERLYCLWPRSDDAGRAQVPSLYLRELARACGRDLDSDAVEHVPRPPLAKLEALPEPLLSPQEASLLMTRAGQDAAPFLETLGIAAGVLEELPDRLRHLNAFGEPGPYDGLVGEPVAFVRWLEDRGLSPSLIDLYAECPFKFFASRVLRLRDVEDPSERGVLEPRVRGQIYHAVLQAFHKSLKASGHWAKPADAPWEGALLDAVDAVFARYDWRELGVYPVLWRSVKGQMVRHLKRFAARDVQDIRAGGFVPALFEEPLRAEGEGPLKGLILQGQPDRVDVNPSLGRFKIVDYKTRWKRNLERMVLSAEAHQPPFYLELAEKNRARLLNAEAAGVYYYALEESPEAPGAGGIQVFTAARWRQTREALLGNVAFYLDQIRRGHFFIKPGDGRGNGCGECPFDRACRKAHGRTRLRAERSHLRAAFEGLKISLDESGSASGGKSGETAAAGGKA